MIERYLVEYEKNRPLGKNKRATLTAISLTWLGVLQDKELTSQRIVDLRANECRSTACWPKRSATICPTWALSCLSRGPPGNTR